MHIFTYQPPSIPWLDIRYKDRDIIVINKPSGLLSNPGRSPDTHDTAITRLQQVYPEAILIHRLDCDTSGIMIFARNKKAESNLKTQFQHRQAKKVYVAEVSGHMQTLEGKVNFALGPNPDSPPFQMTTETGKAALTYFRVLEQRAQTTLMELKPHTGRTHQLRVHMLALGHPILGDEFYADEATINASKRLNLHAQSLTITHPYTQIEMTFFSQHPF
ncbi:RluA family pseudouridine synthase [Shewanella inventionis]|uniref:Pseudouridine synthase n=1 Tax=Shewanella inventionis TaxID=1738770 RepID=A0ABQ1INP7_9GAMM|nr:RluA family pseudouridine synthase [Shewanella inventionis]MCL1159017.1 RluA family pseudouridine synthase [Shewanella inventionis]UAL42480.1 RluA family pseudouridine synthase [Shewanella inventionis]GGB47708.1 RNA pseudouridine synthase [Shewanella inventionis]